MDHVPCTAEQAQGSTDSYLQYTGSRAVVRDARCSITIPFFKENVRKRGLPIPGNPERDQLSVMPFRRAGWQQRWEFLRDWALRHVALYPSPFSASAPPVRGLAILLPLHPTNRSLQRWHSGASGTADTTSTGNATRFLLSAQYAQIRFPVAS